MNGSDHAFEAHWTKKKNESWSSCFEPMIPWFARTSMGSFCHFLQEGEVFNRLPPLEVCEWEAENGLIYTSFIPHLHNTRVYSSKRNDAQRLCMCIIYICKWVKQMTTNNSVICYLGCFTSFVFKFQLSYNC